MDLIHDFTAVTLSVKLAVFCEKCENSVKSMIFVIFRPSNAFSATYSITFTIGYESPVQTGEVCMCVSVCDGETVSCNDHLALLNPNYQNMH